MSVSAVVPTTGRSSVAAAVESAVMQDEVSAVLVVADGRQAAKRVEKILGNSVVAADDRLHLLVAENAHNGSTVRNVGTRSVRTPWVAYCDDDDYWLPGKIRAQLELAGESQNVFSSHMYWKRSSRAVSLMPSKEPHTRDLSSLLLMRDSISYNRSYCATPTLMVPTHVALGVGWDEKLARHQDWDFVLRLAREGNLQWQFINRAMAVVDATSSSVSRGAIDPEPGRIFLAKHVNYIYNNRAVADFATVHIAGVQFRGGDYKMAIRNLYAVLREHGSPHLAALGLAFARAIQHVQASRKNAE